MAVKIHAEISCYDESPRTFFFNTCGCDIGTATLMNCPAAFICSGSLAAKTSAFI